MYPEKKGGSHKMAKSQLYWGLLTLLTRWASIWTMPNTASPKSEPPCGRAVYTPVRVFSPWASPYGVNGQMIWQSTTMGLDNSIQLWMEKMTMRFQRYALPESKTHWYQILVQGQATDQKPVHLKQYHNTLQLERLSLGKKLSMDIGRKKNTGTVNAHSYLELIYTILKNSNETGDYQYIKIHLNSWSQKSPAW